MSTQFITDWKTELQQYRRSFLVNLLRIGSIVGLAVIVWLGFTWRDQFGTSAWWQRMAPYLAAWGILVVVWLWRGLPYGVRAAVPLTIVYGLAVYTFTRDGLVGSGRLWLLLLPASAFALLGVRWGLGVAALVGVTYVALTILVGQGYIPLARTLTWEELTSMKKLSTEARPFFLTGAVLVWSIFLSYWAWLQTLRKADEVNQDLRDKTDKLSAANEQLQRQAVRLTTTAEIARAGSFILDPHALFSEVVNKIQDGFAHIGVYYVGLFLVDEEGESVVLRAATGEAGKLLLEMGHSVSLDDTTPVGRCIVHEEAHLSLGMERGTARFDALPMPNTRSEINLPLRSRGSVLGALSVQSTQEKSFSEEDVDSLQIMADQIAVSIDNARLFRQTEVALEEVRSVHRRYLVQAWDRFLATRPTSAADYTQPGLEPLDGDFLHEAREAAVIHERSVAREGEASDPEGNMTSQTALVVPLKLRGQVIGTMSLHETRHQRAWTADEIAMAETVAEQIALTAENLRLMDETQRRAAFERFVSEISEQMQRSANMEILMRVTADELNRVLGSSRVYVHLGPEAPIRSSAQGSQFEEGDGRDGE